MADVRHRFSCPLRWADLDLLGHVNNVRYADYLSAARADLTRSAGLSTPLTVRRHELTFRAPLMFGREPIVVETWVSDLAADGAVLEHAVVGPAEAGSPATVHLGARTEVRGDVTGLAPYLEPPDPDDGRPNPGVQRAPVRVRSAQERRYALHVRPGDLDASGQASDVSFVEFFQEARIGFFDRALHEGLVRGTVRWVVAQTDLEYLHPLRLRPEPYDCFTRLAHVGTKSLTVESVIRSDDRADLAAARVVLVVFDPVANRSVEPPAGYRELLAGLVTED